MARGWSGEWCVVSLWFRPSCASWEQSRQGLSCGDRSTLPLAWFTSSYVVVVWAFARSVLRRNALAQTIAYSQPETSLAMHPIVTRARFTAEVGSHRADVEERAVAVAFRPLSAIVDVDLHIPGLDWRVSRDAPRWGRRWRCLG